jgi:hypothetical protein
MGDKWIYITKWLPNEDDPFFEKVLKDVKQAGHVGLKRKHKREKKRGVVRSVTEAELERWGDEARCPTSFVEPPGLPTTETVSA